MKRIMVPVDGSEFSLRAIEKAVEIGRAFDSEIILYNGIQDVRHDYDVGVKIKHHQEKNLRIYSDKILEESKAVLNKLNYINYRTVAEKGFLVSIICDYSSNSDVDLIVMGSQGMNAGKLRGIFVGSITRKVINCTDLPVLVVK